MFYLSSLGPGFQPLPHQDIGIGMLADNQGAKEPPSAQETLSLPLALCRWLHTRATSGDQPGKVNVTCLRNTLGACLITHFPLQRSGVRSAGVVAGRVCFRKRPV